MILSEVQTLSAKDASLSRTFSTLFLVSIQLAFGNLFNFVIVFKALLVFQYSNCRLFWTLFKIYLSFFMWLSMSISFEVLFISSFWIYRKTLMIPKLSSISRSVFHHCVFIWISLCFWNMPSWFTVFLSYLLISSVKDESSMSTFHLYICF